MLTIGVPALRIIAVTFVFASVTVVLGYCMSGLGNGMVHMIGTALRQLVVLVPLVYLFASKFGVEKVWYAIWVSESIAVIYAVLAAIHTMKNRGIWGNYDERKSENLSNLRKGLRSDTSAL
jgi:Na+-driven multidrug efflux pump